MVVANHGHEAELRNATEHASTNIGTPRVVANVFRENFFATVWSRNARLNRYPRNGSLPAGCVYYLPDRGVVRK